VDVGQNSRVLTILHCQAIGDSRFLANGSFRVVNHTTGSVNERRSTLPKGASSPRSPDAFTLSPKPFASRSIRFARNQVPRRSLRRIIAFQIC
jgi:hypothetical protein